MAVKTINPAKLYGERPLIQTYKHTKMFFEEDFWFAGKQGYNAFMPDKPTKERERLMADRARRIRKKIKAWNDKVDAANPPFNQTKSMIKKFGGIVPFSIAVGITPDRIISYYLGITRAGNVTRTKGGRWRRGMLPYKVLCRAIVVARYWGVYLTPKDIYPDYIEDPKHVKNLAANKEMHQWIKNRHQTVSYSQFEDMVALLVSTQD